jgi:hypothetical protein
MADYKLRGEVAVTLAGREYLMRATYGFLREVESETGRGPVGVIQRLSDERTASITDLTVIIHAGIRAGMDRAAGAPSRDWVFDQIRRQGWATFAPLALRILSAALSTDDDRARVEAEEKTATVRGDGDDGGK